MELTPLFLVQAQFSFVMTVFQVMAVLGLGLAWFLAAWRLAPGPMTPDLAGRAFSAWLRVFALVTYAAFGLALLALVLVGVAWPPLLERLGNVIGPILAAVAVLAFVVKSTFFGVMLYSRHRVSAGLYSLAVFGTAVGYSLVMMGLVSLQSWLHDSSGATLIDGRFQVYDWGAVIFNPQWAYQSALTAGAAAVVAPGLVLAVTMGQRWFGNVYQVPARVLRNTSLVGIFGCLAVMWAMDHWAAQSTLHEPALLSLLTGQVQQTWTGLYLVRAIVALLFAQLLLLGASLAWADQAEHAVQTPPTGTWIFMLAGPIGLLMWAGLWGFVDLQKGDAFVVGHILYSDLVSQEPVGLLFFGAALLGLIVMMIAWGVLRLTVQVTVSPVIPVHRSRMLP
jgi:cytochrome d ubiquinol oxidase subunit I